MPNHQWQDHFDNDREAAPAPSILPIRLCAEHECSDDKPLGRFASLKSAGECVEALEASGEWPVGFDAVAVDEVRGVRSMYVDGWVTL